MLALMKQAGEAEQKAADAAFKENTIDVNNPGHLDDTNRDIKEKIVDRLRRGWHQVGMAVLAPD